MAVLSHTLEFVIYLVSGIGYGLYFDLNSIEAGLVGLLLICAWRGWLPAIPIRRWWRAWTGFAQRRKTAVAVVFFAALLARVLVLPFFPVPHPVVADEFSHLLIADTLSHGRLTNPVHPLWPHFESLHIIQRPTYNSDYFPGQGAALALGEAVGHPWLAVWLLSAAMCALLCWMLQGWLPPAWALAGGAIAILRFDIASYWINGYYGGSLAALGGALVLGAYPRLVRRPSATLSILAGLGVAILVCTRPFEGLAVTAPITIAVAWRIFERRLSFRWSIPAAVVVMLGVAGLMIYSRAVTGDPLRPPYSVNQATYGWPMALPWFHPPNRTFANVELQRYYDFERDVHDRNSSVGDLIKNSTLKLQNTWRFYFGPALSIPLIMLVALWNSGRQSLLLVSGGLTLLLTLIETGSSPHYAAAATGCFLAALLGCARKLCRRRSGAQLMLAAPAVMLLILGIRVGLEQLHLPFTQKVNYESWCCVHPPNLNKAHIGRTLEAVPGRHLVLVKPKTDPANVLQWIYNDAQIDASRIVWARDLGEGKNQDLLEYFRGRRVWVVDPNVEPATLKPYAP